MSFKTINTSSKMLESRFGEQFSLDELQSDVNTALRGAPTKSGTPGSSISILDAVLLNGFGEVTASSVTISGGRVRVDLNTGEGFSSDATVLVLVQVCLQSMESTQ